MRRIAEHGDLRNRVLLEVTATVLVCTRGIRSARALRGTQQAIVNPGDRTWRAIAEVVSVRIQTYSQQGSNLRRQHVVTLRVERSGC